MIRIIIVTIGFWLFQHPLIAQNATPKEISGSNYEDIAQQATRTLSDKLALTSTQSDSLLVVNKAYYQKLANLKGQNLSSADRGTRIHVIESEKEARIQAILTSDQLSGYHSYMESIRLKIMARQNHNKTNQP